MADYFGRLLTEEDMGLSGATASPSAVTHQGKLLKARFRGPEAPVTVQPLKWSNGKVRRIATTESIQLASLGLGTTPTNDGLTLIPTAADRRAALIRAYTSQSADLVEFQDDGSVTYFKVDADGKPIAIENFKLEGPNGEAMVWKRESEELTSLSGASASTSIQFPADCLGIAVAVRTTGALGTGNGTTGYEVGVSGDTTRYGSVVSTSEGATEIGHNVDEYTTATSVVLTATGGNFDGTGDVRVAIFYLQATAPTS